MTVIQLKLVTLSLVQWQMAGSHFSRLMATCYARGLHDPNMVYSIDMRSNNDASENRLNQT